jgi:uncharacterized protein
MVGYSRGRLNDMAAFEIIDRRELHSDKTPGSRQRFIERYKDVIKGAAADKVKESKGFTSIAKGKEGEENEIKIKRKSIEEPEFHFDRNGGERYFTVPGNDEYSIGDLIPRPRGGDGGAGSEGSPNGEGEDSFSFYLNREEFINLILDDLELPDMIKQNLVHSITVELVNAGHTRTGSPGNMDLPYSMKRSIGRRIGLHRKVRKNELMRLREELRLLGGETSENTLRYQELIVLIKTLEAKLRGIPYIDPDQDIRYRNRDIERKPITSAVMFCLMDVSGSMTENMKNNAKWFFMLLYLFLLKQYDNVHIVFVRHTSTAQEVSEEVFFYDRETGGTVVSSGLKKVVDIITERYDTGVWNVYMAQASDGDNYGTDSGECRDILQKVLLPMLQYMVYVEMADGSSGLSRNSDLWRVYEEVKSTAGDNFEMRKIKDKSEIYPVFRRLFEKKERVKT